MMQILQQAAEYATTKNVDLLLRSEGVVALGIRGDREISQVVSWLELESLREPLAAVKIAVDRVYNRRIIT